MVMIMVEVFSALFGRECDMVGGVHDSTYDSIEDGFLLASCLIPTPLCAADSLKAEKTAGHTMRWHSCRDGGSTRSGLKFDRLWGRWTEERDGSRRLPVRHMDR